MDRLRRSPRLRRDHRLGKALGRTGAEFRALPDADQEEQIAAEYLETLRCPDCGGPPEECGDQSLPWYAQRNICYRQMELARAEWRYDELYREKFHDGSFQNWSETRSKNHPYGHRDGVTVEVSLIDLKPDDDFLQLGMPTPMSNDENGGDQVGDKA